MNDSIDPVGRFVAPLRRWWPIIAAVVVLGVAVAWVTRPDPPQLLPGSTDVVEPGVAYRATHVLVRGRMTPATDSIELVAMRARQGQIAADVAAELEGQVETGAVEAVEIVGDPDLGTLSVSAVQPTADRAALLASTFAEQITAHFDAQVEAERVERMELTTRSLAVVDERVAELLEQQAALDEDALEARLVESELNVLVEQYGVLQGELRNLSTSGVDGSATFETLEEPAPFPVETGGSPILDMPAASGPRLIVAFALSLLLGAGAILGLARLDTRVRTRDDAEDATGLPVVAEVPRVGGLRRGRQPKLVTDPASRAAETFRSLCLSVEYEPRWRLDRATPTADGPVATARQVTDDTAPRSVLVSSPATAEGKTSVAVNLAASLAEQGRRVLLIDCDFRRTSVAALMGTPDATGMQELSGLLTGSLRSVQRPNAIGQVDVVPSGRAGTPPVWFLESGAELVRQALELADVVVFDTGPLLVTNEASALIPWVDAVLLVTRNGRTRRTEARRAVELLARLRASVTGVVLVGGEAPSRTGKYYQAIHHAPADQDVAT